MGQRTRILLLIRFLAEDGGAERFTLALATHLPRDRFEPWVCAPRGATPGALAALSDAGIPFVGLGRSAKWDVHRMTGLATLLRRERFDILHAHLFGSNLWGSIIGSMCRVPVVIAHEHTWAYQGNPLRVLLDGQVIGRLATRFVSVSAADAERMASHEGVPAGKVVVMPTAYVPSSTATGDIRRELGLGPRTSLIATAAVLRPQKALEVLLDAHALVAQRIPEAHLVIAGDGPRRAALEIHVRELGLDGRVHFLGRRRDVDAILSAADVAALSSDYEGMPLFMFECMANRTPLVATAVGGIPDVLDGSSGVLVPPRDPQALADGLTALLKDPARRERLASAAADRLAPYTLEAVTSRFAELYDSLVSEVRDG